MSKFSRFISTAKRLIAGRGQTPAPNAHVYPSTADNVGMISPAEKAFYAESAARYFGREGAIVDLGCWLGATSIALARGLQDHGSKGEQRPERVVGFDRFEWESWMPAHIPYCLYQPGDSFLPEARKLVREHAGAEVELIQADLGQYQWEGGSIKILLVDAMKNEDLARQIARNFFPKLLPGGLLIHQDFKHYYTSWIHLLQYHLRSYFQFYRSIPAGTVAFKVARPIPQEAVDQATEFAAANDDEADAAFRYSLHLVGPEEMANIAAAHVMHYVHQQRKDKASSLLENFRPLGILDQGEFPKALDLLGKLE